MALAVRGQQFAFPHTEFNGDRAKQMYYFCILLYLPLCRPLWLPLFLLLFLPGERALAVKDQKIAFPHTEFNGDRAKATYSFPFLYIFPYVAPYDSFYLSLYFFQVKWPWPSETKNLHLHIQNLTVIEPKKNTIFPFLYIFPYVAPYDSLYFSPYFFHVKRPWPSEAQNLSFHIQNLTVIEPKQSHIWF